MYPVCLIPAITWIAHARLTIVRTTVQRNTVAKNNYNNNKNKAAQPLIFHDILFIGRATNISLELLSKLFTKMKIQAPDLQDSFIKVVPYVNLKSSNPGGSGEDFILSTSLY